MSFYKKIFIGIWCIIPASLFAQNAIKEDTLQGGFLQTVYVNTSNNNTLAGDRYDGQARTEHLLDNIPGLNIISRGNFGQEPVLRGMIDGQINVTINSMHIFGACTDRMDPVSSYVEPNNMRCLQVCTSTCSSTCGASIGGGMNFDLRQAQANAAKTWSGSVGTGFETNAAARQFLGNLQYSGKRFAFSVDGIYRKANDYTPGGNKNDNLAKDAEGASQNYFSVDSKGRINFSQYKKWNAHANALYKLDAHNTFTADYLQDNANNAGFPALMMDVTYARSKTGSITYEYNNLGKALYEWQSKIYYNDITHAMGNTDRPVNELPMGMMMNMNGHSQTAGAYTQLYWKPSSNNLIKAKLESYANRWHADMTMMMAGDTMDMPMQFLTIPDAQRTVVGLDITDEIKLKNSWYLTPGIHTEYNRSSIYSNDGKSALAMVYAGAPNNTDYLYNAFVELSYKPVSAFGFDMKLARGMRAPTLKEMYALYLFNQVDGYDYIGNPGIKKESSYNTEVNFSYKQKGFDIGLKGFGYFFQNYIAGFVQQGDTSMTPGAIGVKQFGNIHSAYIAGASLLFNLKLSSATSFISNNTWQTGKDNNNNYLPYMTPLKSVNTIRYSLKTWRLFAEEIGEAAQNKTSTFYGETPAPDFFITSAGLDKTISLHGSQLILSLSCNNIFNKYYYESIDVVQLPREGRNFIMHLTYNF